MAAHLPDSVNIRRLRRPTLSHGIRDKPGELEINGRHVSKGNVSRFLIIAVARHILWPDGVRQWENEREGRNLKRKKYL